MITVDRLTKAYGGFRAVDDVSFVCRQGRVTGFLGPNGAGKTTTMRVMVGLTTATSGRVTIGGLEYAAIPNPARHVGVLLGDPEVLILDEPANGLDPAGIRWMRGLLKSYADGGGTVLLSSHLLNEVELIADEMILIGHGRIVAQGDKKSLLAGAQGAATSLVMSLDNPGLTTALTHRGHVAEPMGDGLKVNASTEEVGRAALAAGIVLTDLRTRAVPPPPPTPHGAHVPTIVPMPPVDSPLTPPGGPQR